MLKVGREGNILGGHGIFKLCLIAHLLVCRIGPVYKSVSRIWRCQKGYLIVLLEISATGNNSTFCGVGYQGKGVGEYVLKVGREGNILGGHGIFKRCLDTYYCIRLIGPVHESIPRIWRSQKRYPIALLEISATGNDSAIRGIGNQRQGVGFNI